MDDNRLGQGSSKLGRPGQNLSEASVAQPSRAALVIGLSKVSGWDTDSFGAKENGLRPIIQQRRLHPRIAPRAAPGAEKGRGQLAGLAKGKLRIGRTGDRDRGHSFLGDHVTE